MKAEHKIEMKILKPLRSNDFTLFYEKYALLKLAEHLNVLPSNIKHVSESDYTSSYDLFYNGNRYDVKMSSPVVVKKGAKKIWDFAIRNKSKACDFYLMLGFLNGIPQSVFLIPEDVCPNYHLRLSIRGNSKYNKYKIC